MHVQFKQVFASDRVGTWKVEDECARVEQSCRRRRLVGAVKLAQGRVSRFGESSRRTEPFVDLRPISTTMTDTDTDGITSHTCLHAGPDMRMTAIAALPDAVDRAYIVGSSRWAWKRRYWTRLKGRRKGELMACREVLEQERWKPLQSLRNKLRRRF